MSSSHFSFSTPPPLLGTPPYHLLSLSTSLRLAPWRYAVVATKKVEAEYEPPPADGSNDALDFYADGELSIYVSEVTPAGLAQQKGQYTVSPFSLAFFSFFLVFLRPRIFIHRRLCP